MYSPKRRLRLFRDPAFAGRDTTVYTYTWALQSSSPTQRYFMMSIDDTGSNVATVAADTTDGTEGPYLSTNKGATWTYKATGMTFGASAYTSACWIARSAPSILYASVNGGYLYKSTDSGANWTELTTAGSRSWSSIMCSSTGTYVIATNSAAGFIYISTDSGATWSEKSSAGGRSWDQGFISEDGTNCVAIVFSGLVYVSTDSGTTWTPNTSFGTKNYRGLSASSDAKVILASSVGTGQGRPALSTNTGTSWTTQTLGTAGDWWNTAASVNGNKLVSAQSPGYIYVSQDKGATWTQQTSAGSRSWEGVAITADGKTIVAGLGSGQAWVATGT
jgi:hypothetical protein